MLQKKEHCTAQSQSSATQHKNRDLQCKKKKERAAQRNTKNRVPGAAKRKSATMQKERATQCKAKESTALQKRKRQKTKSAELQKQKARHKQKEWHDATQNTEHHAAKRKSRSQP